MRCRELAGRLTLVEDLLRRWLPDWSWRRPEGGVSVWTRLPAGSSTELAQIAQRRGVIIVPGPIMSPTGRFDEYVRLPVDHDPSVLGEGVRRLATAWTAYRAALDADGLNRVDVIV